MRSVMTEAASARITRATYPAVFLTGMPGQNGRHVSVYQHSSGRKHFLLRLGYAISPVYHPRRVTVNFGALKTVISIASSCTASHKPIEWVAAWLPQCTTLHGGKAQSLWDIPPWWCDAHLLPSASRRSRRIAEILRLGSSSAYK